MKQYTSKFTIFLFLGIVVTFTSNVSDAHAQQEWRYWGEVEYTAAGSRYTDTENVGGIHKDYPSFRTQFNYFGTWDLESPDPDPSYPTKGSRIINEIWTYPNCDPGATAWNNSSCFSFEPPVGSESCTVPQVGNQCKKFCSFPGYQQYQLFTCETLLAISGTFGVRGSSNINSATSPVFTWDISEADSCELVDLTNNERYTVDQYSVFGFRTPDVLFDDAVFRLECLNALGPWNSQAETITVNFIPECSDNYDNDLDSGIDDTTTFNWVQTASYYIATDGECNAYGDQTNPPKTADRCDDAGDVGNMHDDGCTGGGTGYYYKYTCQVTPADLECSGPMDDDEANISPPTPSFVSPLEFGSRLINTQPTQDVFVTNTGDTPLTGMVTGLGGTDFTCISAQCAGYVIPAGDTTPFTFRYTVPATGGVVSNGTATFTNTSGGPTANLVITGESFEIPADPVNFIHFTGTEDTINDGEFTTFTWQTTNAISCEIYEPTTGYTQAGLSPNSPPAVTDNPSQGSYTYTLTCENADNIEYSIDEVITVNAPLPACSNDSDDDGDGLNDMADPGCTGPGDNNETDPPIVIMTPNGPTTIDYNDTFEFDWDGTEGGPGGGGPVDGCTADSGTGFNNPISTSGNFPSGPLTADTTYTITCTGPGGPGPDSTKTVTVTVNPAIPVGFTFTGIPLSVVEGDSVDFQWSTTGTSQITCNASISPVSGSDGGWSGNNVGASGGPKTVGPILETTTYILTCTNPAGTRNSSREITVVYPTATLDAEPAQVLKGNTTNITWEATNVQSCSLTEDDGTGPPIVVSTALTDTYETPEVVVDIVYELTCQTLTSPIDRSITVTPFNPSFNEE